MRGKVGLLLLAIGAIACSLMLRGYIEQHSVQWREVPSEWSSAWIECDEGWCLEFSFRLKPPVYKTVRAYYEADKSVDLELRMYANGEEMEGDGSYTIPPSVDRSSEVEVRAVLIYRGEERPLVRARVVLVVGGSAWVEPPPPP